MCAAKPTNVEGGHRNKQNLCKAGVFVHLHVVEMLTSMTALQHSDAAGMERNGPDTSAKRKSLSTGRE